MKVLLNPSGNFELLISPLTIRLVTPLLRKPLYSHKNSLFEIINNNQTQTNLQLDLLKVSFMRVTQQARNSVQRPQITLLPDS